MKRITMILAIALTVSVFGAKKATKGKETEPVITKKELIAQIKTGTKTNAGTNDLGLYLMINKNEKLKYVLNKPNHDDFVSGKTDEYKGMMFTLPIEEIKEIHICADGGDDAWYLEQITFFIKDGVKKSKPIKFRVKKWISSQKGDPGKDKKRFLMLKKIKFE